MTGTGLLLSVCVASLFVSGILAKEEELLPWRCTARRLERPCADKETRWFYSESDGGCRSFKGCAGAGNNFPDEESCAKTCETQEDPCNKVRCGKCERCAKGRCVPDERCDLCRGVVCPGRCNDCVAGACVRRPDCWERRPFWRFPRRFPRRFFRPSSARFLPRFFEERPKDADKCRFVNCLPCHECRFGECFRIEGCVPPPDRCENVQCRPWEECKDGVCVRKAPRDLCWGVRCGPCERCSRRTGECVDIPFCSRRRFWEEDVCANVRCGTCERCSRRNGQCVAIPDCNPEPSLDNTCLPRCGRCARCFLGRCVNIPGCDPCDNVECPADHKCVEGDCVPTDRKD